MTGPVRNLKLVIAYEGTHYSGFQLQKNGPSIQGELERAILQTTAEKVNIQGAGRTDAGVHAKGQVVSFLTHSRIPIQNFSKALNSVLPADIVVKSAIEVALDFHARYSARTKTYMYRIYNLETRPMFERNFVYHYKYPLNIGMMRKAISYLVGEHDFKTFQAAGSAIQTSMRKINSCSLLEEAPEIKMIINADGFLYHMVRNIVGTLILVGNGRMEPEYFRGILMSKDRSLAGPTAPAKGLSLEEVIY